MDCAGAQVLGAALQGPFLSRRLARDDSGEAVSRDRREAVLRHRAQQRERRHQPARGQPCHQYRGEDRVAADALGRQPHRGSSRGEAKTFPKTAKKMLDPIPLSALDANGKLSDDTKQVLDLIAEGDIILAGGHLPASELHRGVRRGEAARREEDAGQSPDLHRRLQRRGHPPDGALGVYMEHSICMFVEGKAHKYGPDKLAHLIEVAGVDHTVLCSDLGLQGSPRPVEGYRADRAPAARPAVLRGRHPHA